MNHQNHQHRNLQQIVTPMMSKENLSRMNTSSSSAPISSSNHSSMFTFSTSTSSNTTTPTTTTDTATCAMNTVASQPIHQGHGENGSSIIRSNINSTENKNTTFIFGGDDNDEEKGNNNQPSHVEFFSPRCSTSTYNTTSNTDAKYNVAAKVVTIDSNKKNVNMIINNNNDKAGSDMRRKSPSTKLNFTSSNSFNFNTSPPNNNIFSGFCTTTRPDNSTPFNTINNQNNTVSSSTSLHEANSTTTTNYHPIPFTDNNKNNIMNETQNNTNNNPYVNVDGRRKRRRVNLNDAFRYLSIMEQQQQQQQQQQNHHDQEIKIMDSDEPTRCTNNEYFSPQAPRGQQVNGMNHKLSNHNTSTNNINYNSTNNDLNQSYSSICSDVNKSMQSYESMDGLVLHSNLDYNHETSFCSLTSGDGDDFVDVSIGNVDDDIKNDDNNNDDESNHSTGMNCGDNDNNTINNTNKESSTLPPIHSILFAPRKGRSKQKSMIYDHSSNPVDDRIEELIRHSRIQAMVKSQPFQGSKTNNGNVKNNIDNYNSKQKIRSGTQHHERNSNKRKDGHNSIPSLQRRRDYEHMLFDSFIPPSSLNKKHHNEPTEMKYKTCDDHDIDYYSLHT